MNLKERVLAKDQLLMTSALLACQVYIGSLEKQLKIKHGDNLEPLAEKYYEAMQQLALFENHFPGKISKKSLPTAPWLPKNFDEMITELELENALDG